ncbi:MULTISPECIES: MFS transporter [Salinibaculum]|uniref:MFS transporter n=1 Tax=Salinibaculum TaxID=2732368 RepID=UPI0030CBB400
MHESAETTEESFVRGYTGRITIVLALGSLGVSIGRQMLPLVLPSIIDELSITSAKAGMALTVMWAAFAVSQYPAGRFADQWSRTTIIVGGLATMVVGFGLLLVGLTYPLFVVSAGCIGIGAGLYIISTRTMLSDLFVERRGQAFGINTSANMVGGAFASAVSVVILSAGVWEYGFLPVLVVLLSVSFLLHLWSQESYVVTSVTLELASSTKRVFSRSRMRWLVVAYTMYMLTWQGVLSFLPTALRADKGFSPELAAVGFAIPFVVGIVVMPLAGKMSDGIARLPITAGGLLLSAAGLTTIILAPYPLVILFGIMLFALGLLSFPPVMQAFLMDVFPDTNKGGDFGIFRTMYFGIGSLGPTYVGFVSEWFNYLVAFAGLVCCLLAGGAIIFWTHLTKG